MAIRTDRLITDDDKYSASLQSIILGGCSARVSFDVVGGFKIKSAVEVIGVVDKGIGKYEVTTTLETDDAQRAMFANSENGENGDVTHTDCCPISKNKFLIRNQNKDGEWCDSKSYSAFVYG